jgi:hypothetical protein
MSRQGVQFEAGQRVVQLEAVHPPAVGGFVSLARQLEADLDQLARIALERLREVLPSWMAGTVFSDEEISRFARASLEAQLRSFRRGVLPERCPEVDAIGAQAAAKLGDLKLLLSGYRIAQMALWQAWFDKVEQSSENAEARNELLRYGSEYFFLYADLLSDYVTDLYQRELEQMARSGEQRRFHAVRTLLEGGSLVGSQLELDLDQHHLGLISWGEEAEVAARELAATLGRPLLLIGPLNKSWWGWISGSRPLDRGQERALYSFQPSGEARLALGLEAFGEAGFRATNRQALQARRVCREPEQPLIHYADVAVEALAADNQTDARAFVAHELRGIDDDTPASERIRETILAYFAAGHNAASAAAALGVHQQTVANRLRAAEERLGRPVGTRRVELETALRLRACLDREGP